MRRAVVVSFAVLVVTLAGCAMQNDRFGATRTDPFVWWLSGAPQPYELNWPRSLPPDLPVLNPVDYQPIPPPRPLDMPRGWNPAYPPYLPTGADAVAPASADEALDPGCATRCIPPAPGGDRSADPGAGAGVRAGDRPRQP